MTAASHTTRRAGLAGAAAVLALAGCASAATGEEAMSEDRDLAAHAHDWDWLEGAWNVRHRRLQGRLVGSTEWEEFDGWCEMRKTMGGFGNVDDNVVGIPSGAYRAMGVRAFNRETRQWSIWWLDERYPATIEPPVRGGFVDGAGEFTGDDTLNGQPIKVRFRWTDTRTAAPRWEQAFSADDGETWEVNSEMEFRRA